MLVEISQSEKEYIISGINEDMRLDGRGCLDYRPFILETGLISQTNGSARLILDGTDVLVGIKVEIGEPDPLFPDQGRISVTVECCPSASPEYEGRGAEVFNVELSRVIERLLTETYAINMKSLCLVTGRQCWVIYIDAMVLDSAGNLFDAISITTRAALFNTKIPKVNVVPGNSLDEYEIELTDDPDDFVNITIEDIPICITLTQLGNRFILDSTLEEEKCLGCRVTIAVNKKGNICGIQKGGNGSIDNKTLKSMIQNAQNVGKIIIDKLDFALKEENTLGKEKIGFFM